MNLSEELWNQEIYNILKNTINNQKIPNSEKNAVFDFDNTLIFGDQGFNLMYYLILNLKIHGEAEWFWNSENWKEIPTKEKEITYKIYLQTKTSQNKNLNIQLLDQFLKIFEYLEKQSLEFAYRWTKIFYSGFSTKELKEYSEISFQLALKQNFEFIKLPSGIEIQQGIRINPALYELIQILLKYDWNIYIITASPEIAIQAISKYWNLPEKNIIGMKLKQKNDILLPEIEEPYTYNYGKYLAFRNIVQDPIYIAVGDSYPDIYLLENAKIPIFVNHAFKEPLLKIAQEKNFLIQNFTIKK